MTTEMEVRQAVRLEILYSKEYGGGLDLLVGRPSKDDTTVIMSFHGEPICHREGWKAMTVDHLILN